MTACPAEWWVSAVDRPVFLCLEELSPRDKHKTHTHTHLQRERERGLCSHTAMRRVKNKTTGGGAFLGLAAYSYFSGHSQLEQQKAKILASNSPFGMRSRRLGITGISLALAWLGIWRLVK